MIVVLAQMKTRVPVQLFLHYKQQFSQIITQNLMKKVLLLGGYGNFGSIISRQLSKDPRFSIIIAGRSYQKALTFLKSLQLQSNNPENHSFEVLDITKDFKSHLQRINPDYIVHTCGPFQGQNYAVAQACIDLNKKYIDLADGRQFVNEFSSLDQRAQVCRSLAISGASSLPALSAAVIDKYIHKFRRLQKINYGISTAQRTNPGVVTVVGVFSYTGRSFKTLINGSMQSVIGWQDFHAQRYQKFGWRIFGNCQVPDLDLFPKRYPSLQTLRFYAGTQLFFNQIGIWMLSWLVRFGIIRNLSAYADFFQKLGTNLDVFGSGTGGMHIQMQGQGHLGERKVVRFELTAKNNDGPYIPCIPAILLIKMLAEDRIKKYGAFPCVDLIALQDYINAFRQMNLCIETQVMQKCL